MVKVRIRKFKYKVISMVIVFAMIVSIAPLNTVAADTLEAPGKVQAEFFVAPTGSDKNDGSFDHPFASLQAARDAVRKINSNMTGNIYVFIASGDYYVNETINFNESDSGTNGFKIIYRNLDGLGTAKFIGGNKVTSQWSMVTRTGADSDLPASADGKVYKTNVGKEINFNTLYVNDTRATMARTKNLTIDPRFPASSTAYMRSAGGTINTLVYNSGDLDTESLNGLVNAQKRGDLDAQVYMWDGGYWDWMTDTIPIDGIDTTTHTLKYKQLEGNPAAYRPKYATGNNARYFLQGNLGFLDQPGEYYYNKTTGDLYYYPLSGSGSIDNQDIVIPAVEKIIDIKGKDRTKRVSHIEFSGLELKDTNFPDYYSYGWNYNDAGVGLKYYPPEAKGSTQPSYCEQSERAEFQVGVITLTNTDNITISKNHIKNAGMFGIELYLDNQHTTIKDCNIEYTGHGGINLEGGYPGVGGDSKGDGYNSYNTITNCIIHDIGQLVGQTAGITINNSGYNKISHVEIYNSPRRGIFLTAGHSRNGSVSYPNGDADFNIMTDMYSHHNTFEYIYLHDCQQDGGDDGAFFACYLYKGSANYKPNYINQMLIDSVAANPSMRDIAPNGMNLDMGCSGFELSNLKIVNPQHFNAEVNTTTQYGDNISYTNTNIDFGSHTSQIGTFDDSKMEYGKIGVTSDFPSAYLPASKTSQEPDNIYFKENFENEIDLTKWSYSGTMPALTTEWMSEGILSGKQSLKIDSDSSSAGSKPVFYRNFTNNLNKIVTVKLFDRQSSNLASYDSGTSISSNVKSLARVDNGTDIVGLGLDTDTSSGYYVLKNGSSVTATSVPRTYGWHELKWDYSSGNDVKLYIDNVLVKTLTTINNFNYVAMGSEDGKGVSYYDQLYIYGGKDAPAAGQISLPAAPPYDSSNDNKVQLNLDFEDGVVPNFTNSSGTVDMSVVEDPTNPSNKVLKDVVSDGSKFYETGAPWNNYIVNMKWKFVEWGSNNVLGQAYDNFTIYVMTAQINGTTAKNPASYQVIYRRNKNGTNGFQAGTPYFEVTKHTSSSDTSLGKRAVPDGFVDTDWHNLQIQTYGGKVGFVVDGNQLLSVSDGAYTYGGVAFGGINSTVLMDDINIISNPTYVSYKKDFNLANVNLNGEFNPSCYFYGATVIDNSKPVTLVRPKPVLSGTTTKVVLNDVDITNNFADYTTPAQLQNLKYGRNTLVLSEITSAGTKNYTIYIDKDYTISSIGSIADVTTNVGTIPVLPKTTDVTFKDGTSQTVNIKWDNVNASKYKNTGAFTVTGQLDGLNATVSTTVTVEGLKSIDKLDSVYTTAGTAPVLAKTIKAEFTKESKDLSVAFADFYSGMYANAGTIIAIGNVDQYAEDVLQKVVVMPVVKSTDATLSSIKINDTALNDFSSEITDYNVTLPAGTTEVPTVTAATSDSKASAVVTAAEALPGKTTIVVTAEDGTTTNTYNVNFTVDRISTVTIAADNTTLDETKTGKLSISGKLESGSDADLSKAKIEYTSSNTDIVSVDDSGVITAKNAGSADITAKVTLFGTVVNSNKITISSVVESSTVEGDSEGQNKAGSTDTELPKTGSSVDLNILILLGMIAISGGAILLFRKKRID